MSDAKTRRILGPFNRVEGDLELRVQADESGQRVEKAWVNSPLFRGFEQMLVGRPAEDALVITPRICGICSVAQSVAAASALASARGLRPTANGQHATNIVLATENLADHLSHFYLFFMPDFARDHYSDQPWHTAVQRRFKAQRGEAMNEVLQARAQWLHITALLAGKWPHSLAIQPGGTTCAIDRAQRNRLITLIRQFQLFLERCLFGGASIEQVLSLSSAAELDALCERHPNGDLAVFCQLARELKLTQLGRSTALPMSFGAYAQPEGGHLFARGLDEGGTRTLDIADISEDISHAWLRDSKSSRHPREGQTDPHYDTAKGYSWCKAPRLGGAVVEVGALARQRVAGQSLISALVAEHGSNVFSRELARLIELASVSQAMLDWATALDPAQPFIDNSNTTADGEGCGLMEAARGSLGHWLQLDKGKISHYQIIAPTTWNFSPRDAQDQPGPLEAALVGVPLAESADDSVALQHVIRSYDPCMVCTVH